MKNAGYNSPVGIPEVVSRRRNAPEAGVQRDICHSIHSRERFIIIHLRKDVWRDRRCYNAYNLPP